MQIQNIATPQKSETPQVRYASLHRTIDRGTTSDYIWSELSRVCVALGFNDEAVEAYLQVETPPICRSLEVLLAHHGLLSQSESQDRPETGFRHLITDPFRFLFLDHMPLTVIVATLTLPLVVGLGGFFTAENHFLLFAAITLLPCLAMLGVVGALGRRIMVEAGEGIHSPPPVPDVQILCREAPRFLVDMLILCLILLGPGAMTLLLLPGNLMPAVASLFVGMFLMPMAMLMSEFSEDWRELSPFRLLHNIGRGGYEYVKTALVISALFLPAALSALATMGSHFYVQVSIIGPLIVVPLFVSCRILGRFFHDQRSDLQVLIGDVEPVVTPAVQPKQPRPVPRPKRAPLRPSFHPESRVPKPGTYRRGRFTTPSDTSLLPE